MIAFIYENSEFKIEIIVRFIKFVFIFINFIELNKFMWMLNFCIVWLILCLKILLILNLMFWWQLIRCKRLNLKLINWLSIWCNEKLNIRWRYDFLLNVLMRWLKFLTFCLIFFIFWSLFWLNFRWIEQIIDVSADCWLKCRWLIDLLMINSWKLIALIMKNLSFECFFQISETTIDVVC